MLTVDISEAAQLLGVTKPAVYIAAKEGKLKSTRDPSGQLRFTADDLKEYRNIRYNRDYSTFDGKPLFDVAKGEYTLKKAAEYMAVDYNTFYYYMRKDYIKSERRGAAYIFKKEDLDDLKAWLLTRDASRTKGA